MGTIIEKYFDFHRPRFRNLDCIDLVMENKLLLLLIWDTVHTTKICIRPGKAVYRETTSAAICMLPPATESVDIILHNVWRSAKVTFRLKSLVVDAQTLLYLDEHYLMGPAFSVVHVQPASTTSIIQLKKLQPEMMMNIKATVFNITIDQYRTSLLES